MELILVSKEDLLVECFVLLRESVPIWVGEGQSERETENLKEAPCSVWSPALGLTSEP